MTKHLPLEQILGTKKLESFIAAARHYCFLVEDKKQVLPQVFLPQIRWALLILYTAALNLEWVNLQSNEDPEVEKIDLPAILQLAANKIGEYRFYWSVFDPTSMEETDAGCDDLLDDLGDIYTDLKYSLSLFDLQTIDGLENAVWSFKFDFSAHWGQHCINALRALHYFIQKIDTA